MVWGGGYVGVFGGAISFKNSSVTWDRILFHIRLQYPLAASTSIRAVRALILSVISVSVIYILLISILFSRQTQRLFLRFQARQ